MFAEIKSSTSNGMIPKLAIEKAVKENWRPWDKTVLVTGWEVSQYGVEFKSGNWQRVDWQTIALDPSFWQALGKSLGWRVINRCDLILREDSFWTKKERSGRVGEIVGETRDGHGWLVRWSDVKTATAYPKENIRILSAGDNFKSIAHRFYDLILQGQSTETFWKELLK